MSKAARLYLLRHGPTTAPQGCFAGSTDAPLSGQGLEGLPALLPHLQGVETWYCSPLRRAFQTLEHLQKQGCQIAQPLHDARLREIDFGAWELKTFAEIAAAAPARVAAWQDNYESFVFPDGEAVADFLCRTKDMLAVLAASGSRVAAVTHGGVIRAMLCAALNLPPRSYLLFDVRPASLTVLDIFSNGGVLRALNLPGDFA
jgi:broad specificity phosphatase PhoE